MTVLSAGSAGRRKWPPWPTWAELQDELAALSSASIHIYAVNTDHNVHLDDPGVVVQAICNLVERCRQGATARLRPPSLRGPTMAIMLAEARRAKSRADIALPPEAP